MNCEFLYFIIFNNKKTMQANKFFILIFLILLSFVLYSQEGYIRGTIYDDETGETLPGVNIYLDGTTYGNMSDLDGKFNLSVPAGKYTLKISMISFETIVIKEVVVKAGDVTLFDKLRLKPTSLSLNTVTVTAKQVKNNELALTTMKRKSVFSCILIGHGPACHARHKRAG